MMIKYAVLAAPLFLNGCLVAAIEPIPEGNCQVRVSMLDVAAYPFGVGAEASGKTTIFTVLNHEACRPGVYEVPHPADPTKTIKVIIPPKDRTE